MINNTIFQDLPEYIINLYSKIKQSKYSKNIVPLKNINNKTIIEIIESGLANNLVL